MKQEVYVEKKEFNGILFDDSLQKWIKTKFQIIVTENEEIIYTLSDGIILRMDLIKHYKQEIMTNLEQIKNLQWKGQYGKKFKKVGEWKATWKGKILKDVGGMYSDDGKKQGQWREIIYNFSEQLFSQLQVYQVGQYLQDQRVGLWKYIYEDEEIGGGCYQQGVKCQKWVELSDELYKNYVGINFSGYYESNKKIGRWNYQWLDGTLIGGGSYDQQGQKSGIWVDLDDYFQEDNIITYHGQYYNSQKIGLWDIHYYEQQMQYYQHSKLVVVDSTTKMVLNVVYSSEFYDIRNNQVVQKGVYNNGVKVGKWDITWVCGSYIGGGSYDDYGIKTGKWIDLANQYNIECLVTHNGVYKNGQKVGIWNVSFENYYIGGGLYDEQGIKTGRWVDLNNQFNCNYEVTYNGVYQNGLKVGLWNVFFYKEQICQGSYDLFGLKTGNWVDIFDAFNEEYLVTYNGEYKNGQKFGKWVINYRQQTKPWEQIGAGFYDEDGLKIGKWMDLENGFQCENKVTYEGEYKNGKKIGRWNEYHNGEPTSEFIQYEQ